MTIVPISDDLAQRPIIRSHRILLEDFCIDADIGFFDFEVGRPQRLIIDVEISINMAHWPKADTQTQAWDYNFIRDGIKALVANRRFNLQETLAGEIFDMIAARPGVQSVTIMLRKPDIYPDAKAVGIVISSD